MPNVVTRSFSLAADKRTVRIEIVRNEEVLWADDLGPSDVDLILDALREMREQMVEDSLESSN
jgi:hypothetical protein